MLIEVRRFIVYILHFVRWFVCIAISEKHDSWRFIGNISTL